MGNKNKILGIIPARGGSKGLPGKNIRMLCGKPLIAWSIDAAIQSDKLDSFVVSSDCNDILDVASKYGCQHLMPRPAELATDQMTLEPVILDILDKLDNEYTHILLLQPTSPLRTGKDIDGIIEYAETLGEVPVIGVSKAAKSPYISYSVEKNGHMTPLFPDQRRQRRQDMPDAYIPNGALYYSPVKSLTETGTFVPPQVHAYIMSEESAVDIDSEIDLLFAELLLSRRISNKSD